MFRARLEELRRLVGDSEKVNYDDVVKNVKERKKINADVESLLRLNKEEYTFEEKQLLAQYTGRGGLKEGDNDEYYTPTDIAKGSWNLLGDAKDVLDPSAGTGIFSSQSPSNTQIVGCELNEISGKVADILNDNSTIKGGISFEEFSSSLPDNSFDGVITNVPFGNRDPLYRSKDRLNEHILKNEDYFILKSMDKLKYGKRAVFLTTSSTAQRKNKERKSTRRMMLEKGSFVGGYRLPSAMFSDTGTEQVVDCLIFEKHPENVFQAIKNDSIGDGMNEIVSAKHNKQFLDGVYFDKNEDKIFGQFISREDMIDEANKSGKKLHHLSQKDTVELSSGMTLADVKKKYQDATKKASFKNLVDYHTISINSNISMDSTATKSVSRNVELLKAELGLIGDMKLSKLMTDEAFTEAYDESIPSDKFSDLETKVLGVRYFCTMAKFDTKMLSILLLTPTSEYTPDFLSLNHEKIEELLLQDRNVFKGIDVPRESKKYVLDKFSELTKFDLKTGVKVDISKTIEYFDEYAQSNSILNSKEHDLENGVKIRKLSSFTSTELEDKNLFVDGDRVVSKRDYVSTAGTNNYIDLMTRISSESEIDESKKTSMKDELLKYKSRLYVEDLTMNAPMLATLISDIFASKVLRETEKENRALKETLINKAIAKLKESDTFKNHKALFETVVKSGWMWAYLDSLLPEGRSNFFENNLEFEIGRFIVSGQKDIEFTSKQKLDAVAEAKALIREGFSQASSLLSQLIKNTVLSNKIFYDQIEMALDERAVVKFPLDMKELVKPLEELRGMVNDNIIPMARHYQNEDAREFGGNLSGTMAQDTGLGKGHTPDTEIITSKGMSNIGQLKIGDFVIGSNGLPTRVTGVFPRGKLKTYRVNFIDGESILCDEEHIWNVRDSMSGEKNRKSFINIELKDMLKKNLTQSSHDKRYNTTQTRYRYGIPFTPACNFSNGRKLKIHPYVIGFLIGNGSFISGTTTVVFKNRELCDLFCSFLPTEICFNEIPAKSNCITGRIVKSENKANKTFKNSLNEYLKELGLYSHDSYSKFIPSDYLYNSLENRKALFQGLVDSDGHILRSGNIEFGTSSKQLMKDYRELALSLGIRLGITSVKENPSYIYKGEMKYSDHPAYSVTQRTDRSEVRAITNITQIEDKEIICISVEAKDSLYVVGRGFIVTHNTISMIVSALYAIKSKKAKRVLITTPNPVFSKFLVEAKKVLSEDFFTDNFISATTDNIMEVSRKLQKDKNIRMIILPNSVLDKRIALRSDTVSYLYGTAKEKTEEIYGNPLSEIINAVPKYTDANIYFEDLGIDALFIDEAHFFKNGATLGGQVKGMSDIKSDRAVKIMYIAEYIRMSRNDKNSGVVTVTATPETSSPHEIYNNLILSGKGASLARYGIRTPKDFKDMFLVIEEEAVAKISDGALVLKNVLKGMKHLDMLRDAGLDSVIYRSAETEQARALSDGKVIRVKPEHEILDSFVEEEEHKKEATEELKSIHNQLASEAKAIKSGHVKLDDIGELHLNAISRYGEVFGLFNRIKKVSMSIPLSKGVTPVKLKSGTSLDEVLKVLSSTKITFSTKTVKEIKRVSVIGDNKRTMTIADIVKDPIYEYLKDNLPSQFPDLLVGTVFNIPTNDYKDIKSIIKALSKGKLLDEADMFNIDSFSKLKVMINNVLKERKRHPSSKQIIYATSLVTHTMIEFFIHKLVDKKAKVFLYNGVDIKDDDSGLKVQNDFNDSLNPDFVVFNEKGQVGVDFNKNVCATHLLEIPNTPDANHQAMGRAVRQGNDIDFVNVYKYYQEGTFDYFMDELVSDKANWIDQVKSGMNSVSISSDKVEEIYSKALKKYASLPISDEEKVKKYQDHQKELKAIEDHEMKSIIMVSNIDKIKGLEDIVSMNPISFARNNAMKNYFTKIIITPYSQSIVEILTSNPFSKDNFTNISMQVKKEIVNRFFSNVNSDATKESLKSATIDLSGDFEAYSSRLSAYLQNNKGEAQVNALKKATEKFFNQQDIDFDNFVDRAVERGREDAKEYIINKVNYYNDAEKLLENSMKELLIAVDDKMVLYGADRQAVIKGIFTGESVIIGTKFAFTKDIISINESYNGAFDVSYKGATFTGRKGNFYKQKDMVLENNRLVDTIEDLRTELFASDKEDAVALFRFIMANS